MMLNKVNCGFPDVATLEWEYCIEECLMSMGDGQAWDCWLVYKQTGSWPPHNCYEKVVECDCIEFLDVVPAPDPEVINCLRTCEVEGIGEALEYYDQTGNWKEEYNHFIDACDCGEDEPTYPGETPIDCDMRDCVLNCSTDAFNCWSIFHETGEWSEACKDIMRNCDCYDPDDQHDCYRKALNYIKNELILEPYSNACAVLEYVRTHFNCIPLPLDPNEPGIPGDLPDDWDDDGGNDSDPDGEDGPYDEYQRKPIWWYHSDHLGSSTYLTDNFGRPSHYYETLPFGEMIVEHNQSSYYKDPYPTTNTGTYDNKWKFNGKELDDATGMYYYGARYYDPRISIFISVDPLAEQTMEPYIYCSNDPINFIDPDGKNPIKALLKKMLKSFADDGVKHVARTSKGGLKPVSRKHAEKILKEGKSVMKTTDGSSNKTAKKLMKDADRKSKIVRYDGHDLKNVQGESTGKTGFDHYKKKSGDGSHVFYDSAKSIFIIGGVPAGGSISEPNKFENAAQKAEDIMFNVRETGAKLISPIENIGTGIFGEDSDIGKAIDEINPFNSGVSNLVKEVAKDRNNEE